MDFCGFHSEFYAYILRKVLLFPFFLKLITQKYFFTLPSLGAKFHIKSIEYVT